MKAVMVWRFLPAAFYYACLPAARWDITTGGKTGHLDTVSSGPHCPLTIDHLCPVTRVKHDHSLANHVSTV